MRSRRKSRETNAELDITSFMNLMVILIPFLLLNAVFTQLSVLQVNLPKAGGDSSSIEDKKPLVLEVIIYQDRLIVADRQSGPLKTIPNKGDTPDLQSLSSFLKELKSNNPSVTEATILLEQRTPYESLVHTMDAVRMYDNTVSGVAIKSSLFPDIGIGDAPADPKNPGGEA